MSTITLTHKIRLDPTFKQASYFKKACGTARFTWNWALAEWKRQYEQGEQPNGLTLKKQFNALKQTEFPWIYEVTKYASQQPFIHINTAFQRFFQKKARYPRFKKRGIHDSFYIGNDHIALEGAKIKIPRLGWVRMRESLRFTGKVLSATISRVADKWFVSLNVELNQPINVCENQACIGVDLGIKRLASLYNGKDSTLIEGPKPLKNLLKNLKRKQRSLSRKQKGSNNRGKQRIKVARLYERIRNIRQDTLHKLTTHLTENYGHVVIEDLNVKGMMQNRTLSRHIADMGFYEFRRQLDYKSKIRKNHLEVVDRWYPSSKRCSGCGSINEDLKLSDREYHCKTCGVDIDRDINAAKNLYQLGLSTVSSTGFEACGERGAG